MARSGRATTGGALLRGGNFRTARRRCAAMGRETSRWCRRNPPHPRGWVADYGRTPRDRRGGQNPQTRGRNQTFATARCSPERPTALPPRARSGEGEQYGGGAVVLERGGPTNFEHPSATSRQPPGRCARPKRRERRSTRAQQATAETPQLGGGSKSNPKRRYTVAGDVCLDNRKSFGNLGRGEPSRHRLIQRRR